MSIGYISLTSENKLYSGTYVKNVPKINQTKLDIKLKLKDLSEQKIDTDGAPIPPVAISRRVNICCNFAPNQERWVDINTLSSEHVSSPVQREYIVSDFELDNSGLMSEIRILFLDENNQVVEMDDILEGIFLTFYYTKNTQHPFICDFFFHCKYTCICSADLHENPKVYVSRDIILPTIFANLIGYHGCSDLTRMGVDATLWTESYPSYISLERFSRRCKMHNIEVYFFNLPLSSNWKQPNALIIGPEFHFVDFSF